MEKPQQVEAPSRTISIDISPPPEDEPFFSELQDEVRQGKPLHSHTDSSITVRLSTTYEVPEPFSPQPGTPAASKHESMSSRPDSGSDVDGSTRPTSLSESVEYAGAKRTSATDSEDASEDAASLLSSPPSDDTPIREDDEESRPDFNRSTSHSRSVSLASSMSENSKDVDWDILDRNEQEEEHREGTDESTAFLLARLEQENNALATNPKAGLSTARARKGSRPPSMQQMKKLVSDSSKATVRYSSLPDPPPMTELEFWTALVRDYPSTAQRLPTLTANKIRQGIPPPLRGVVWQSIAGAREASLEEAYDRLCLESSPYENLIHKDIGRSFPGVDMFRDPDGDGQRMLGQVLNAYSLYDQDVGYCQGLGFVVGPLLMQMGDKEAFCTLARLMEHYGLRSCFTPKLEGLHLRVFQFQRFLTQYLPHLSAHLDKVKVEPLYITQWFLSFFGVTCPIPMLIRLYDVILTEGASETLMRVALSVMRRNEKKLMALTEFEEIMQLLLSRVLWDPYNYDANALMADFCHWTGLVTRESLNELETTFNESKLPSVSKPGINTAAQRFLGRLWNSSGALISPRAPLVTSPGTAASAISPTDPLERISSNPSIASVLNSSTDSSDTSQLSLSSDATSVSRRQSADLSSQKSASIASPSSSVTSAPTNKSSKEKDFHTQIEDLLNALNNAQRETTQIADQLQKEREERDEDRQVVLKVLERLQKDDELAAIPEDAEVDDKGERSQPIAAHILEKAITELDEQFSSTEQRSSVVVQSKMQLREDASKWKAMYQEEVARAALLTNQLEERDREMATTKEDLREARMRVRDGHKEKQRLEKVNSGLRTGTIKPGSIDTGKASHAATSSTNDASASAPSPGLRELKLGRSSTSSNHGNGPGSNSFQTRFSKRISSLSAITSGGGAAATAANGAKSPIGSTVGEDTDNSPVAEHDVLLVELANAKTAEATAKQDLEEMRTKLESLRKMLSGSANSITSPLPSPRAPLPSAASTTGAPPLPSSSSSTGAPNPMNLTMNWNPAKKSMHGHSQSYAHSPKHAHSSSTTRLADIDKERSASATAPAPVSAMGGFFSGWGKRNPSSSSKDNVKDTSREGSKDSSS